jgi:hypothetical protein
MYLQCLPAIFISKIADAHDSITVLASHVTNLSEIGNPTIEAVPGSHTLLKLTTVHDRGLVQG